MDDDLLAAILVVGLATWRLAGLLVYDKIFLGLREWTGITHTPIEYSPQASLEDLGIFRNFLAQVLICLRCTSVWAAFFVTIMWVFGGLVGWLFGMALAASQIAIVLNSKL